MTLFIKKIGILLLLFMSICCYGQQKHEVIIKTGHSGSVNLISVSEDGKYIASVDEKTIKVWKLSSKNMVNTFSSKHNVNELTFIKGNRFLIAKNYENLHIEIWDIQNGVLKESGNHNFSSLNFSFGFQSGVSSDSEFSFLDIIEKDTIGTIKKEDFESNKYSVIIDKKAAIFYFLDNKQYPTFSSTFKNQKGILKYDAQKNRIGFLKIGFDTIDNNEKYDAQLFIQPLDGTPHKIIQSSSPFQFFEFHKNGKSIASYHLDGKVRMWSSPNYTLTESIDISEYNVSSYGSMKFSNAFKKFYFEEEVNYGFDKKNNTIILKDSLQFIFLNISKLSITKKVIPEIQNVSYFDIKDNLIFLGYGNGEIEVRDLTTWSEVFKVHSNQNSFRSLQSSQNLKYIIAGCPDSTLKVWNLENGTLENTFENIYSFNQNGKGFFVAHRKENIKEINSDLIDLSHYFKDRDSVRYFSAFSPVSGKVHIIDLKKSTSMNLKDYYNHEFNLCTNQFKIFQNPALFAGCGMGFIKPNVVAPTVRFYDIPNDKFITIDGSHRGEVFSFDLDENSKRLITGDGIQTGTEPQANLTIYENDSDADTFKLVTTWKAHSEIINDIEYSKDKNTFYSASSDNTIKKWDLNGNLIKQMDGHNDAVSTLFLDETGTQLLSAGQDSKIRIWDVASHNPIVDIYSIGKENYAFVLPNFYYFFKGQMSSFINLRIENNIYPIEQFDLKYNRPDLVLKQLSSNNHELIDAYYRAYQKRLRKLNFTREMLADDFHVPEISIENENLPLSSEYSTFTFGINAIDSKQNLDRINVYINDVPIYGINGINIRDKNVQNWEQDISLTLSRGNNKIQVSALNQGGAESLKETFYITYDAPEKNPNLYLVTIGAEKFKNPSLNLTYPIKDLRDVGELFQAESGKYQNVFLDSLYNENVSIENLEKIKQKLHKSQVDDHVILFVSGHGVVDKELDYYFANSNIDFKNPADNGIPYEALEGLLDGIPARQKLFLMDACHSGEIDKENVELIKQNQPQKGNIRFRSFESSPQPKQIGLENSFELMKQLFIDLRRGTGATVISSAGGVEFAWEGEEWNNSVFTYCLLSALKDFKADANNDKHVTVSELREYLTIEVPRLTGNHQRPTMRVENITNDFRIW